MLITSFARVVSRLRHDTRANVTTIVALCAIPMFAILGFAMDYGTALSNKSKLDNAADAAALAAVKLTQTLINNHAVTREAAMTAGSAQAIKTFSANVGNLALGSVPMPQVTWTAGSTGQTLSNSVTYTMTMNNLFSNMVGIPTTTLTGTVSTSTVLKSYYQFIFLVDISGSMAIGATANDITGLQNDSRIQCAFACHDPNNNRGPNYRAFAAADGWKLKIDYVNSAVQTFIQDLKTQTANIPGVYTVGIDTFATSFNVLQSPTDLTTALAAAQTIDIEPMMPLSVSQGYTRTTTSLNDALAQVQNIGDGSSPTQQKTYFIFLSDGVEDIEGNLIYGRGSDVSYTTACADIKQAGATLISIEANYPVVSDNQYPILVTPIASQLMPAMRDCATDTSWFYQATDGPGINSAVGSALQQILQGVIRVTH